MTTQTAPPKRTYRMAARAEAAAATRDRIAAAAWRHFSERPYEDVRIADVAADAGVSIPTVHTAFGPKEGLFVAAWAAMAVSQGVREEAVPGDVVGAIRILWDTYEQHADAVFRLLAQEDRIPAVHQMAEAGRAYHRGWVERTFAPQLAGRTGVARQRRLAALIVATDVVTWRLLRREMGLASGPAERTVIEMIRALEAKP